MQAHLTSALWIISVPELLSLNTAAACITQILRLKLHVKVCLQHPMEPIGYNRIPASALLSLAGIWQKML